MRLTHELIKKKSEHNDGVMADLEEISLHQLEIEKIESINDCRKLKILYLQNNIINKLENLYHLKDLEYLNMALNNLSKIEGLRQCEFLNKLDLTVNFIGIENLESSIEELKFNHNLKELFLLGNPCVDWPGCQDFVIGSLPSLRRLDGTQITKTMQIQAAQRLSLLTHQLREAAKAKLREKLDQEACGVEVVDLTEVDENGEELTGHSPELRTQMYREQAAEKASKEAEKNQNKPPTRSYDEEHKKTIAEAEAQEASGKIRQCNTGGYKFTVDETKSDLVVDVFLPKHLDSCLIDVHPQPTFVRVVIKNKILRLRFDCEVRPDSGTAKRSKVTGNLLLTMPKVEQGVLLTAHQLQGGTPDRARPGIGANGKPVSGRTRYFKQNGTAKKMAEIMEASAKAVNIRGIAKEAPKEESVAPSLTAMSTTRTGNGSVNRGTNTDDDDDDDAPLPPSMMAGSSASAQPSTSTASACVDLGVGARSSDESDDEEDEEPPPLE